MVSRVCDHFPWPDIHPVCRQVRQLHLSNLHNERWSKPGDTQDNENAHKCQEWIWYLVSPSCYNTWILSTSIVSQCSAWFLHLLTPWVETLLFSGHSVIKCTITLTPARFYNTMFTQWTKNELCLITALMMNCRHTERACYGLAVCYIICRLGLANGRTGGRHIDRQQRGAFCCTSLSMDILILFSLHS